MGKLWAPKTAEGRVILLDQTSIPSALHEFHQWAKDELFLNLLEFWRFYKRALPKAGKRERKKEQKRKKKKDSITVWLQIIIPETTELRAALVTQLWLKLESLPRLWEPGSSSNCDHYFSLLWCFLLNYVWDLCCRCISCGTSLLCRDISETAHMKGHSISVTNHNDKAELEVTCEY